LISNSPGLPSGPSVSTMNLPSRLKNRERTPKCSNEALEKSPSTVESVAWPMASLWCEPAQSFASCWWQEAQAWLPT